MKVVVSAGQMAAADRYTIEQLGTPGLTLMETAAAACFEVLIEKAPTPCPIALVIGGGNNGGDGLALARLLTQANYPVQVFVLKPRAGLQGDAARNYDRLVATGVSPIPLETVTDLKLTKGTVWVVDAIFGTGLRGAASGVALAVIEKLNQLPIPILAIDIPSGLSGDHGRVLGDHIQAKMTVTFQNLKYPHVISPACIACGEVFLRDIGIQFPEIETLNTYFCEAGDYFRPSRELNSHKGKFGYLAVLGGFLGMQGAANLAGIAALRFGAGKVRILTNHDHIRHDSLMQSHWQAMEPEAYDAWVIGPGLSRNREVFAALAKIEFGDKPIVWDADGLYFLKDHSMIPGQPWIITPHPGEAAYLLDSSAAEVQSDRVAALRALAEKYPHGWIVLKGYRTLVSSPAREVFVIGPGNPALATAGSGDVLAGMIGAMLAQGFSAEESVLLACLRHGMAADRWLLNHPDHSMLAEDIHQDLRFYP